jgi:hypothetical protein
MEDGVRLAGPYNLKDRLGIANVSLLDTGFSEERLDVASFDRRVIEGVEVVQNCDAVALGQEMLGRM